MTLKNNWNFSGEVVRKKDFGDGKGGNIIVKGTSQTGTVELSVFLSEEQFKSICDKDYPVVTACGHIEQRTWATKTGNLKHSLKHICDVLELAS